VIAKRLIEISGEYFMRDGIIQTLMKLHRIAAVNDSES